MEQIQIIYDDNVSDVYVVTDPNQFNHLETCSYPETWTKQNLQQFFWRYNRRDTLDTEPELSDILDMKNDQFRMMVRCTFLNQQGIVSPPIWLSRRHLELNERYKRRITEWLQQHSISQQPFVEEVDDI